MPRLPLPGGKSISFGKSKAPGKGPEGDPTPRVEATGATNNPLADPDQVLRDQWVEEARHLEANQGTETALGSLAGGQPPVEDMGTRRMGTEAWRKQHDEITDPTEAIPAGEGGAAKETGQSVRSDSAIPRYGTPAWDRLLHSLGQDPEPADGGAATPDTGAGVPPLGPPEAPPVVPAPGDEQGGQDQTGGVSPRPESPTIRWTAELQEIARTQGVDAAMSALEQQRQDEANEAQRRLTAEGTPGEEPAGGGQGNRWIHIPSRRRPEESSTGGSGTVAGGEPPPREAPTGSPAAEVSQPSGPRTGEQGTEAPQAAGARIEVTADDIQRLQAVLDRYGRMAPEQLQAEMASIDTQIANTTAQLGQARSPQVQERIQNTIDQLRTDRNLAQDILGRRQMTVSEVGTPEAERRAAREFTDELRKLSVMDLAGLEGELETERSIRDGLREETRSATGGRLAALEAQVQRSEAREATINRLLAKKGPPAAEAKAKAEAKKLAEEFKEAQKEVGAVREIAALVETHQNEFARLKTEIKDLNERLAQAIDSDRRKEIEEKIREAQGRSVEVGNKLKDEKEALKKARERQREEAGVREAPSRENIREMSVAEYLRLKPEDRAKFLEELSETVGNPNITLRGQIEAAIRAGAPLSIEHRAMWAKDVADRLINKERGRGKVDMKLLYRAGAQYPEIAQAVLNRIAASDAVKALEERYKGNFAKMLDWAKKDWHWLWILLAIAGGTTVAAVGPITAAKGAFSFAAR